MSATNGAWAGQVGHRVHGLVDKVGGSASLGVLLGSLRSSLLLASSTVDLLGDRRVVAGAASTGAVGAWVRAAALDLAKRVLAFEVRWEDQRRAERARENVPVTAVLASHGDTLPTGRSLRARHDAERVGIEGRRVNRVGATGVLHDGGLVIEGEVEPRPRGGWCKPSVAARVVLLSVRLCREYWHR